MLPTIAACHWSTVFGVAQNEELASNVFDEWIIAL